MSDLRALQKKVHVGCRELGLDSEARRDLQLVVTGKASMSDMDEGDLTRVLERLKESGFKPVSASKGRKRAPRADLRLVHVLWRKLGEAGALKEPSRAGLNAFIRKRFSERWGYTPVDVDALTEWSEIDDLIQALKAWGQRAEIDFDWEDVQ